MIDEYDFGRMQVDGQVHTNDLKIFPEVVKGDWWRDEGHLLQKQDVQDIIEYEPDLLIIGQGYNGRMKIDPEVKQELKNHDIKLIAKKSTEAVEEFNQRQGENVVGAFHLTC